MEYEKSVRFILKQLGIGRSYQGYDYIVDGVLLVLEDASRLEFVTKSLYPDIAKKHHTSWNCVERNIRTVIDVIWKEGSSDLLFEICGDEGAERPKNTRFLELMCEYVKRLEEECAMAEEDGCFMERPGDCFCPESGNYCERLALLRKQIICLKREKLKEEAAQKQAVFVDVEPQSE